MTFCEEAWRVYGTSVVFVILVASITTAAPSDREVILFYATNSNNLQHQNGAATSEWPAIRLGIQGTVRNGATTLLEVRRTVEAGAHSWDGSIVGFEHSATLSGGFAHVNVSSSAPSASPIQTYWTFGDIFFYITDSEMLNFSFDREILSNIVQPFPMGVVKSIVNEAPILESASKVGKSAAYQLGHEVVQPLAQVQSILPGGYDWYYGAEGAPIWGVVRPAHGAPSPIDDAIMIESVDSQFWRCHRSARATLREETGAEIQIFYHEIVECRGESWEVAVDAINGESKVESIIGKLVLVGREKDFDSVDLLSLLPVPGKDFQAFSDFTVEPANVYYLTENELTGNFFSIMNLPIMVGEEAGKPLPRSGKPIHWTGVIIATTVAFLVGGFIILRRFLRS